MTPKSMTPYLCFGFTEAASLDVACADELVVVELLDVFAVAEPVAVLIVEAAETLPLLVAVADAATEPVEV